MGGTSAGAAALTELTLAGNEVDEEGKLVEQYIGPGLGLLGFKAQLTLSSLRVGIVGTGYTFNLRHRELEALLD